MYDYRVGYSPNPRVYITSPVQLSKEQQDEAARLALLKCGNANGYAEGGKLHNGKRWHVQVFK